MREQRLVFGEDAELYDRARAGYPDDLIDDVLGFVGLNGPEIRALEVGAGTGKATVPFALRGLEIVALEPSAAMAAVAERNCRTFPAVRLELASFEDWRLEAGGFQLLFSAQAWHWVRRGCPQRQGGGGTRPRRHPRPVLAPHRLAWRGRARRPREAVLRVVPELYAQAPGFPGLAPTRSDEEQAAEVVDSPLFTDVALRTYRWAVALTPDGFVDLLLTQSNHRLLPEDTRTESRSSAGG